LTLILQSKPARTKVKLQKEQQVQAEKKAIIVLVGQNDRYIK